MAVADFFLVNTRPSAPLNADVSGLDTTNTANQSKVTDFVTQQSFFSFTASTAVGKFIWKGFQKGFGDWADKTWAVPLAFAILFGLVQFAIAMKNDKSKLASWSAFIAFAIAVTNTLVLWFAILGVEPAAEDVGIT